MRAADASAPLLHRSHATAGIAPAKLAAPEGGQLRALLHRLVVFTVKASNLTLLTRRPPPAPRRPSNPAATIWINKLQDEADLYTRKVRVACVQGLRGRGTCMAACSSFWQVDQKCVDHSSRMAHAAAALPALLVTHRSSSRSARC